jgi:ribosome-binding protein aMBF1 (putative translation factor)
MNDRTSVTSAELFAGSDADPERRARWERLALARAVADAVLDYRVQHQLSQRQMAERLEMKPSAVARLEIAEHNPTLEMLQRLARVLEVRFMVWVAPAGRAGDVAVPHGLKALEDVRSADGGRVLVAAG